MNERLPAFPSGSRSLLAREVSAEVRARLAAKRVSGKQLAEMIGVSQNYLAKRLRDELPFTLDDIDAILDVWDYPEDPHEFLAKAHEAHGEDLFAELMESRQAAQARPLGEALHKVNPDVDVTIADDTIVAFPTAPPAGWEPIAARREDPKLYPKGGGDESV